VAISESTTKKSESEIPEAPAVVELRAKGGAVLKAAPHSTFFHIVALLERLTPDAVRIGGDGPPGGEKIRFRHDPELSFSAGDICAAQVRQLPLGKDRFLEEPKAVFEVTTTFLGLTGAISPLPIYIAEEVLHEEEKNPARRDFLDIFHHRFISFFYRAIAKFAPPREHLSNRRDPWMVRALSLTGLDPDIQARGSRVHPSVLVRLAPLLAGRGRGPRVLALALYEALAEGLAPDGTVDVKQFAGGWIEVDQAQRMALGEANNKLGAEAILGARAYDQTGRFSVQIGPLHQHNYRRFLRDGDLLPVVKEMVQLCVREPLDFDVELKLAPDAVPSFTITNKGNGASELGRETRLRGRTAKAETMTMRDVGNMSFPPTETKKQG
jgi:type VI secretion system protein ImpH